MRFLAGTPPPFAPPITRPCLIRVGRLVGGNGQRNRQLPDSTVVVLFPVNPVESV